MSIEPLTRTQRMVEAAPDYYHYSKVYYEIQKAQGEEYNSQDEKDIDLQLQLRAVTATWGLKYWEEMLDLPTDESEDLELRRSKVLAMLRSGAPFSATMLEAVVNSYTKNDVKVTIDVADSQLYVITLHEFVTQPALFAQVDNIIHAHLGIEYRAKWIYPRKIHNEREYHGYKYPFPILSSDILCGLEPEESEGTPSTWGRLYKQEVELSRNDYYTGQEPYAFTGTLVVEGVEVENLSRSYSSELQLSNTYHTSENPYSLTANLVATDLEVQNISTLYSDEAQLQDAYYNSEKMYHYSSEELYCGTEVYT